MKNEHSPERIRGIFVHQRAAGKEGVGVGERKNLKLRICLTPLMMLPSQAILVLMQSRPPAMLLTLTSMNPSRTLSRSMNPSLQRTEGGNREQMLNLPVDRPLQFQRERERPSPKQRQRRRQSLQGGSEGPQPPSPNPSVSSAGLHVMPLPPSQWRSEVSSNSFLVFRNYLALARAVAVAVLLKESWWC